MSLNSVNAMRYVFAGIRDVLNASRFSPENMPHNTQPVTQIGLDIVVCVLSIHALLYIVTYLLNEAYLGLHTYSRKLDICEATLKFNSLNKIIN